MPGAGDTWEEDRTWQRLDKWLWCARFLKHRSACARWVAEGSVRINRQPTEKPHARLRPHDVLTLPVAGGVRVVRVLALAARRGPAPEARLLYEEIADLSPTCPASLPPLACPAGLHGGVKRRHIPPPERS